MNKSNKSVKQLVEDGWQDISNNDFRVLRYSVEAEWKKRFVSILTPGTKVRTLRQGFGSNSPGVIAYVLRQVKKGDPASIYATYDENYICLSNKLNGDEYWLVTPKEAYYALEIINDDKS